MSYEEFLSLVLHLVRNVVSPNPVWLIFSLLPLSNEIEPVIFTKSSYLGIPLSTPVVPPPSPVPPITLDDYRGKSTVSLGMSGEKKVINQPPVPIRQKGGTVQEAFKHKERTQPKKLSDAERRRLIDSILKDN